MTEYAPRGEIRRSPDGMEVAVCVAGHPAERGMCEYPETRWHLVTPETDRWNYGWRSDTQVTDWERIGNALSPSAPLDNPL